MWVVNVHQINQVNSRLYKLTLPTAREIWTMKLYDLLLCCTYDTKIRIYATNDYDQNMLLENTTVLKARKNEEVYAYFERKIEVLEVVNDILLVKVRNFHRHDRLETQYSEQYTSGWDYLHPDTRPYRTSLEIMEELTNDQN